MLGNVHARPAVSHVGKLGGTVCQCLRRSHLRTTHKSCVRNDVIYLLLNVQGYIAVCIAKKIPQTFHTVSEREEQRLHISGGCRVSYRSHAKLWGPLNLETVGLGQYTGLQYLQTYAMLVGKDHCCCWSTTWYRVPTTTSNRLQTGWTNYPTSNLSAAQNLQTQLFENTAPTTYYLDSVCRNAQYHAIETIT